MRCSLPTPCCPHPERVRINVMKLSTKGNSKECVCARTRAFVYGCVCGCIYECMYLYAYAYPLYKETDLFIYMYFIYKYVCMCVYIYISTHRYTDIFMHAYIHTWWCPKGFTEFTRNTSTAMEWWVSKDHMLKFLLSHSPSQLWEDGLF